MGQLSTVKINTQLSYFGMSRSTSMQGKLLQHNLEPEVVLALKDLKKKLSESEST